MNLDRRTLLGCLAALALPACAKPAAGVMLARVAPGDVEPAGFLVSEKFDGVRAVWDGRVLRFRSGLPVPAPAWFLSRLPPAPLDGELWLGRGQFEALAGTVRKTVPVDAEWRALRYQVFDAPQPDVPFSQRAARIEAIVAAAAWPQLVAVAQQPAGDRAALARRFDAVVRGGGEGLMLHRADALWQPGRSDALLKLKPQDDAEAVVVGHVAGRGRYAGQMGALQVRNAVGVTFLLGTGFSDALRAEPPAVGTQVSYTYRGLTANGVPRFASFLRVRSEHL